VTGLPPGVEPQRLLHEVRWRRDQFLSVLESLCRAESPSLDAHRQQAVHAVLAANLDALGYAVRELPGTRSGGHLYARPRRRNRGIGVQLLLGHSKLESTVRYLGIEVDDALEISEQTEI
jgi:GNAT superfamily N-acetyltransferase